MESHYIHVCMESRILTRLSASLGSSLPLWTDGYPGMQGTSRYSEMLEGYLRAGPRYINSRHLRLPQLSLAIPHPWMSNVMDFFRAPDIRRGEPDRKAPDVCSGGQTFAPFHDFSARTHLQAPTRTWHVLAIPAVDAARATPRRYLSST